MIVAVDGPAAAGKGTLARRLAAHYDLAYVDTGLLYRAVGLALLRAGADTADPDAAQAAARALDVGALDDPSLRSDEAAQAASEVAAIPEVRTALLDLQRQAAETPPQGKAGVVMDGRDIGTVVCPHADVKIFVTASLEARAERRLKELRDRGIESIASRVLQDMKERDARDQGRKAAPLVPASDAFMLDTTDLDVDAALAAALEHIDSRQD